MGFLSAGYACLILLISFRGLMSFGVYLSRRVRLRGILLALGTRLSLLLKEIALWQSFAVLYMHE